jgi:hypothetical protein
MMIKNIKIPLENFPILILEVFRTFLQKDFLLICAKMVFYKALELISILSFATQTKDCAHDVFSKTTR